MVAIPRYRPQHGPVVLRPGFVHSFCSARSGIAIPIWLAFFTGQTEVATAFSPVVWHVHEMIFGFGAATVVGFLLTAIPNWTAMQQWHAATMAA